MVPANRFRAGFFITFLLAFAAFPGSARTRPGHDFTGFYNYTEVNDSNNPVLLNLNIRLVNRGDVDVVGGTISVLDFTVPNTSHGQITGVTIAAGQDLTFSRQVAIPKHDYELWQQGRPPKLVLEFTNPAGEKVRESLQLTRGPVGGN